jgi:hypothetical protein
MDGNVTPLSPVSYCRCKGKALEDIMKCTLYSYLYLWLLCLLLLETFECDSIPYSFPIFF